MTQEVAGDRSADETPPWRWLLETAALVALAFLVAQGVKTFLAQPFVIPSGSMEPTIMTGNRVLAEKLTYRFSPGPAKGDIVVFDDPERQVPELIKRVIAVGGQTVDLRHGSVYVDGVKLDEPYTHGQPSDPLETEVTYPVTVRAGYLWLMGDNRTNSGDSRVFGPVPATSVRGRAFWTYWPPASFGTLQ